MWTFSIACGLARPHKLVASCSDENERPRNRQGCANVSIRSLLRSCVGTSHFLRPNVRVLLHKLAWASPEAGTGGRACSSMQISFARSGIGPKGPSCSPLRSDESQAWRGGRFRRAQISSARFFVTFPIDRLSEPPLGTERQMHSQARHGLL